MLIIGLEDIIMGRVYSGISEGRVNDLKWAFEMLSVQFDQVDRNALMSLAQRNGMQQATEQLLSDAERIRQKSTTP